jgi:hypothetical protein
MKMPRSNDLYFPEFLTEEDRLLWIKELQLAGEFESWHFGLAEEGRPDRYELKTRDWTAFYEDLRKHPEKGWRLERGSPRARNRGTEKVAEHVSDYIRNKLAEESFLRKVVLIKEVGALVTKIGEGDVEEG